MKRKVEYLMIALGLAIMLSPLAAHARNCELPHEQIQLKCGGNMPNTYDFEIESHELSVSAVNKPRPADAMLQEYYGKVDAYGNMVRKANKDYRDYLESKRR
jgi:hypothetical protein